MTLLLKNKHVNHIIMNQTIDDRKYAYVVLITKNENFSLSNFLKSFSDTYLQFLINIKRNW